MIFFYCLCLSIMSDGQSKSPLDLGLSLPPPSLLQKTGVILSHHIISGVRFSLDTHTSFRKKYVLFSISLTLSLQHILFLFLSLSICLFVCLCLTLSNFTFFYLDLHLSLRISSSNLRTHTHTRKNISFLQCQKVQHNHRTDLNNRHSIVV